MASTLYAAQANMAQVPAAAAARAAFDGVHIASRRVNRPRSKPIGAFWGFASIHKTDHNDHRKIPARLVSPALAISTPSASNSRKKMHEAGSAYQEFQ